MANVIEEFPRRHRGRPPIYDWDTYSDGQNWVCYQGTDFQTSPTSFRALVHRTANSRGMKAQTIINKEDKSVAFHFYREDN